MKNRAAAPGAGLVPGTPGEATFKERDTPAGADTATATGVKEKLAGYVPRELLASVKDAVSAVGSHES